MLRRHITSNLSASCFTGFAVYQFTPEKGADMPSQTTLNGDDKAKVKSALITPTTKILTAVLARIYYAYPQPGQWSYAGLQGALALVNDKQKGCFSLKMVDLAGTRGVIWEHEFYEGFDYFQDRPFFHSFAGDVSHLGVSDIDSRLIERRNA